jgi:hypothetical protein
MPKILGPKKKKRRKKKNKDGQKALSLQVPSRAIYTNLTKKILGG